MISQRKLLGRTANVASAAMTVARVGMTSRARR
jgi:hypothetical protein